MAQTRSSEDSVTQDMFTANDINRLLGLGSFAYSDLIEKLIRHGELTFVKIGTRRYFARADVERIVATHGRFLDLGRANERIAALEEEVDALRGAIREFEASGRMRADEALRHLTIDEALDAVQGIRRKSQRERERERAIAAEEYLQRQADKRDQPEFIGKRPRGFNKNARRRTISTGIGEVDIWYWQLRNGKWRSGFGGPRPEWPGGHHASAAAAIKWAGYRARSLYGKPDRKSSVRLRFAVLERCGFACVYCGRRPPDVTLHVDHVVPVAKGGSNEIHNLVAACRDCNLGKHARELETQVGEPAES